MVNAALLAVITYIVRVCARHRGPAPDYDGDQTDGDYPEASNLHHVLRLRGGGSGDEEDPCV